MNPLLERVLEPGVLALLIPVVAVVGGITAGITKMVIQHRERMAKLEQGIDPDAPQETIGYAPHASAERRG